MNSLLTTNGPEHVIKDEIEISETVLQEQRVDAALEKDTVYAQVTSGSGRTSETRNDLTQHDEVKAKTVAKSFPCPKCLMLFSNRKLAQSHMRKTHGEIQKRFETCPICLRTFRYKSVLFVHLNNHREKVCPICNVVVLDSGVLKNHVESLHIGKLEFVCPICFKLSIDSASHDDHVSSHNGRRRYECVDCSKYYASLEGLERHCITHAGIVKNKYLVQHLPGHSSVGCSVCSKTLSNPQSLRFHMNIHSGTRPYQCDQCPKSFARPKTLTQHRQKHLPGGSPIKCSICSKTLSNSQSLRFHMNIHSDTRPYKCDQCPKGFPSPRGLAKHRQRHITVGSRIKCSLCPKTFGNSRNLRLHMNIHTGTRPYKCNHCPNSFASPSGLTQHRQTHLRVGNKQLHLPRKSKEKKHKCSYCQKSYIYKYNLRIHINTHTGARPFQCGQCSQRFASPRALSHHRPSHLPGGSPVKCSVCSKTLSNLQSLRFHMNIHSDMRPYQCDQCPKSFATPWALAHHRPKHLLGGSKLNCSICSKSLCSSQKLRFHMNIHAGTRPYKCDQCPKSFASPGSLTQHRQRHLPIGNTQIDLPSKRKERKHKCSYCLKSYTSKHNLRIHIYTHTGTRPFKCKQCPKSFTRSWSLTKHCRSHSQRNKSEDKCIDASLKCHQCEKSYVTRWGLARHHRDNPSHGSNEYKCSICSKAFISKRSLNNHLKTHFDAPLYKCDECPKEFYSTSGLLQHRRIHLTGAESLHKCPVCYETFTKEQSLVGHMNTHAGLRPHKCDQCPKDYATLRGLNVHLKKHVKKSDKCKVDRPDKSLHAKGKDGELDKIADLHTALAKYKCKECDKEFISERNLSFHLRLHVKGLIS